MTRGKRLVVVVGQPKALAIAVKGAQARRRWSNLKDWLGGEHVNLPIAAAGGEGSGQRRGAR